MLRLRAGAPDPHTQTDGLLMLAATNEQVQRINDATQAVRQAAEAIERRWHAARDEAGAAAGRAAVKQFDAEHTRWWQPGRRERLQAEAAVEEALSERALAEATELARHAAELQRQLGGPPMWRLAREQVERADATYQRDRQRAHEADQDKLTRLRDRITSQETVAIDADTRHDELLVEQQLRTQAIEQQQLIEQTVLRHQAQQSIQVDLDYHRRSVQTHLHRDIDRGGPGVGP